MLIELSEKEIKIIINSLEESRSMTGSLYHSYIMEPDESRKQKISDEVHEIRILSEKLSKELEDE